MRGTIIVMLACAACGSGLDSEDKKGGNGHGHTLDAASAGDAASGGGGGADAMAALDANGSTAGGTTPGTGPYFETAMFFNQDVSAATKSTKSDAMIAALVAEGGWGNGNVMQIDFSIDVLTADASTPHEAFTPTSDWSGPDCDTDPVPVPAGGDVEGNPGYACLDDGDCHLLVNDTAGKKLYEMWRANITGGTFYGGCLAVWDETRAYGATLRGDQCTSADAAGFPLSPMLINADEVAAGQIDHAIRFILPNNRTVRGYTRPAVHGTSTTGSSSAPAYGVHLRLRADYPVDSLPSTGAKVVARALQKYGMYHADGGNIALTAQTDTHTTAKWSGLLGSHDLAALKVSDFEVIDHGATIPLTYDCVRD
jgi:serine/threonine-protein kinase